MDKGCLFAAAVSVSALLVAPAAHAGFTINYTVTPGVDALAGNNVFRFYAKNDGTGEQLNTKSLLAMEITFATPGQPFTFDFRDTDGDTLPDANIFGKDFSEMIAPATFMRFGQYPDWISVVPAANKYSTRAGANPDNLDITPAAFPGLAGTNWFPLKTLDLPYWAHIASILMIFRVGENSKSPLQRQFSAVKSSRGRHRRSTPS